MAVGLSGVAFLGCASDSDNNRGSVAGTDNGGESVSEKASFVNRTNGYCSDFAELARLGDKTQDSSDLQAATRATAQYAQKGEQLASSLNRLSPPAGTEDEWNRFVDAIRATARTEGEIITSLQDQDLKRLQELEPELQQNQAEFVAAGRALRDAGIKPDCLGE